MKNPNYKNFKFLCSFLATKEGAEDTLSLPEIKEIDWEKIFQLADGYLVVPALYLGLKRKDYLTYLDTEARNFLEAIYELNCERNHRLKDEALSVIRLLNSKDIKPVLLKGVAGLLTGLYEDDGERVIGDIDLLVDQSELAKVVRLLLDHGCSCEEEVCEQVFQGVFVKHELTLMTEDWVKIDLHVRPTGSSGAKAFVSSEGARKEATVIEVDGAFAMLPAPLFRLMHNFYHAHHLDHTYFLSGRINLRQLIDWGELWERYGNTACLDEISYKVRKHRKSLSHRLYLLNAWRYLGLPIPKGIKISWVEKLLFHRQKLCIQSIFFNRINRILVYIASGPLLFTPERMRLSFGDLPLRAMIVKRIKRLLEVDWYLLRIKEMRGL